MDSTWKTKERKTTGREMEEEVKAKMEEEVKATGKTWHELKWLAQDRKEWRRFVAALYSTGSDEDDED